MTIVTEDEIRTIVLNVASGTFRIVAPEAYRGPYEYSVPGAAKDFLPQHEA